MSIIPNRWVLPIGCLHWEGSAINKATRLPYLPKQLETHFVCCKLGFVKTLHIKLKYQ